MRTVFGSHNKLAHVFAQGVQYYGRAGNMYFRNNVIYSYGSHFPIARIIDKDKRIALYTTRDYSVSTSKHKAITIRALSHYTIIPIDNVMVSDGDNDGHRANLDSIRASIVHASEKADKARVHKAVWLETIRRLQADFSAYVDLFGLGKKPGNCLDSVVK